MADQIDTILDAILKREGDFAHHPNDRGGRTQWGITERDFPGAWKDHKVTIEEAKDIYRRKFVNGPGFDRISDPHLQHQLIDYGVNSGPAIAIQKLQGILGTDVDGVLGPATLAALAQRDAREVNNLLVAERVKMIGRIVVKDRSQLTFLNGWLNRALSFLK